jgi:hypothetical protein
MTCRVRSPLRFHWIAPTLVVVATLAAYHNALSGPFIFDDALSVTHNTSIRSLWPLSPVMAPPSECTVAGRPFANLTFALNYAWGGTSVRGYHVVNLGLHIGAALLLFGVVRRTLELPPAANLTSGRSRPSLLMNSSLSLRRRLADCGNPRRRLDGSPRRFAPRDDKQEGFIALPPDGSALVPALALKSGPIALAVALIWAVHPLLTVAVTYISQRTEILMGLFYLATLYTFIRGTRESPHVWFPISVAACFLGMASKEGMVTVPVLVLL